MSIPSEHVPRSDIDPKAGSMSNEMQTLTSMIRELEDQLDRMIAANDALNEDLRNERQRRIALESSVEDLGDRLRREQRDAAIEDDLRAEVRHLNGERARLTAHSKELSESLAEAGRRHEQQVAALERAEKARMEALEEVSSVEDQFERAMRQVADVRAQLTILREERDASLARVAAAEAQLRDAQAERDELAAEVRESRSALDEIRRSITDAIVTSSEGGEPA